LLKFFFFFGGEGIGVGFGGTLIIIGTPGWRKCGGKWKGKNYTLNKIPPIKLAGKNSSKFSKAM
jgi:hypothetical protein